MDNVSYALKMAGGLLLVVLVISLISLSLNRFGETQKRLLDAKKLDQIKEYNEKFVAYEKSQMYGTDVISIINLAYNENIKNRVWTKKTSNTEEVDNSKAENINDEITVKVKLKTPLTSSVRIYYFDGITAEKQAGIGENVIKTNTTVKDIFKDKKEEYLAKLFDNVFRGTNISSNSTLREIGGAQEKTSNISQIILDKNINQSTIDVLRGIDGVQRVEKQNRNFNIKDNNWTKFVWETYASDLKKRHFTFVDKKINPKTGKVDYMEFREI